MDFFFRQRVSEATFFTRKSKKLYFASFQDLKDPK